jgi:hypothetical protein
MKQNVKTTTFAPLLYSNIQKKQKVPQVNLKVSQMDTVMQ